MGGADGGSVPIVNARVCLLDHHEVPCSATDGIGKWSMDLPPTDSYVLYAITFSARQHLGYTGIGTVSPYIAPGPQVTSSWPGGVGLETDAWATDFFAKQAGFTYPTQGTGFVDVRLHIRNPLGLAGATVEISSPTAKGPVYENEMFTPDPSITSTTLAGAAWFANVPPGEFTVTVHSSMATCSTRHFEGNDGWWPEVAPNVVKAQVGPDTMVQVEMSCQ
jgi:hypothetical protein